MLVIIRGRSKSCFFCANKDKTIDYKDIKTLQRFISDRGKIIPRRITGNCAARAIALLPYVKD